MPLPDPRERPWLTVAQLAQITGEGEKAIRAAIAAGHLPSMSVGRYVRIPTAALLRQLGMTPDMDEAAPGSAANVSTTDPGGTSSDVFDNRTPRSLRTA